MVAERVCDRHTLCVGRRRPPGRYTNDGRSKLTGEDDVARQIGVRELGSSGRIRLSLRFVSRPGVAVRFLRCSSAGSQTESVQEPAPSGTVPMSSTGCADIVLHRRAAFALDPASIDLFVRFTGASSDSVVAFSLPAAD